jgi:EAL domain-containing protein (putative c-di-GMP-specific phosphodiesterase class I)/CheY-like chemotaxis protein
MSTKKTRPDIPRAGSQPKPKGPRVLVVEDEAAVAAAIARVVENVASYVGLASTAAEAMTKLTTEPFDVVVTDIGLPDANGTDLIRQARTRDFDLPVIFVTGSPSVETAAEAIELGAFRYLPKPIDHDALRKAVQEAGRLRALSLSRSEGDTGPRAELAHALRSAIARSRIVYQPIVAAETHKTIAYEALMRCDEPALPNPGAVLEAAEKLGQLHALGRHLRNLVAADMDASDRNMQFFVNMHAADLADPELYDKRSPLSTHARRVVLEVTERASLEGIPDLDARRDQLRDLGYRLAVDDLGAGYAGLSYFTRLKPDIVKIDMSLVRGVESDALKQRVVLSLASLSIGLGMEVVAEGVETVAERDTVVRLGCALLQGYGLARPGPPFPTARWD